MIHSRFYLLTLLMMATLSSQKLFTSLILLLLNVVLPNLFIPIMGDSYDKVQQTRALTDSLTRLGMSLEAIVILRLIERRKKTQGKGYLIYCEPDEGDGDDDPANVGWEVRINVIKKALKSTDQRVQPLVDKVGTMDEKICTTIEKKMGFLAE